MAKSITLMEWKDATLAIPVFQQSVHLKAITSAFEVYEVNKTKLPQLREKYDAWAKEATPPVPAERTQLATARVNLKYTIDNAGGVTAIRASEVKPDGWTLKAWTSTEYPWTTAVAPALKQSDLTPSQIARVNEAIRRAKQAAQAAHDALVGIKQRNNFTATPLPPQEKAFKDYFKDTALLAGVLQRFAILKLAFSQNPTLVDVRNTLYGMNCYAACFRKNLTFKDSKNALTLTGSVEMFLGRDFFKGGGYEASTDATVGTMIHEFAHGSFEAVDAPRVMVDGSWELAPSTAADELWATPQNDKQSSTPELDKRLADKEPQAAYANADSYGQFAKEIILLVKK